ncbi:hypothetical protein QBC41DRAFT_391953 [Cercophora samala]|uniref:Uncharacterized protein n=1 Tax=Cercophora samala TaxID=330535 RepID=A0AA40DAF6_9PEZI|nr:hypothetical protein QBC41DRAFT_391953 [Cercophora samala]
MVVFDPPDLTALAHAASTPLHTRPRTPPNQMLKFSLPVYKPPSSSAAAAALPPAIQKLVACPKKPPFNYPPKKQAQTTDPQPPGPSSTSPSGCQSLGSTTQEMDTFFSPSDSQPTGEYALRPPPQRELPRDEMTKAKMGKEKWMAGYGLTSPCELPKPVKQTTAGSDGIERGRWVGVRVDKEVLNQHVHELDDFDSDCEQKSEHKKGEDTTPKERGKVIEDDEVQEEDSSKDSSEDEGEEEDDLPDEGAIRKIGKRETIKERIQRFGRSLTTKKKPRMRERRDQTPGPCGRKKRDQTLGPSGRKKA